MTTLDLTVLLQESCKKMCDVHLIAINFIFINGKGQDMIFFTSCTSVLMEVSWTQFKIIIIINSVLYLTNVIHIDVILYTYYCTVLIFCVK